jgi:hypothetical protein
MAHSLPVSGTSSNPRAKPALEVPVLVRVQLRAVLREDVLVGGDEKASGAASRIADSVFGGGAHDVYDALN